MKKTKGFHLLPKASLLAEVICILVANQSGVGCGCSRVVNAKSPTKFEMDAHELGKPKQEWIMAPFNRSFVDADLDVARMRRKETGYHHDFRTS